MPVVKSPARTAEEARKTWREATAVCFDVDSTLITIEAIDLLAHHCGAGEEVAKLEVGSGLVVLLRYYVR